MDELQKWILDVLKNTSGDELRHIHWHMRAEDSNKADRLGVGAFDRHGRTKVARALQQLRAAGKVRMVDKFGHTEWSLAEDVNVSVKKGDTILVGKWKNKPIKVTSQGKDDHGMPTINGRKAVTFRKPENEAASQASIDAKHRGLQSIGFGRYTDPRSGKVVAKSEKGRLVNVEPKANEPSSRPTTKSQDVPHTQISKKSDIPEISPKVRWKVATRIDRMADLIQKAKQHGQPPPNINLCKITIPGTNLYCGDNLGIPRKEMPQFKGTPVPGSRADKLPKNREGQVDTEPLFREMLKQKGIKTVTTEVPADQLKATQSELVGSKVIEMEKRLEENPNNPGITAPIYVSRDGYVVDGHHRWAAVTSFAVRTGKPLNMKVHVINMDAKSLIPMANDFAAEMGVSTKKGTSEGVQLMRITRTTLRALVEAEMSSLGSKLDRLGGRYGGEPEFAISDPGNKDVENPVVQNSSKGGSNKSIRRPISK